MTKLQSYFQRQKDAARGATERPWHVVSDLPFYAICDDPGPTRRVPHKIVQTVNQANWKHSQWRGGIESKENADFIVTAVNNHALLIAMAEKAVEVLRDFACPHCNGKEGSSCYGYRACQTLAEIEAMVPKERSP